MNERNRLLAAALAYARFGWAIHPLRPGDKRPLLGDWPRKATTDVRMVQDWWARWPDANIGLACGASGLFVIDLDVKGEADGLLSWANLRVQHALGDLVTPTTSTPSGGQHLFFAANGSGLGNSAGRLGTGIDTRGQGGYVLLPPSLLDGGKAYTWVLSPREQKPVPLPQTLVRLLAAPEAHRQSGTRGVSCEPTERTTAYAMAAVRGELGKLAMATIGTRNNTLNAAAYSLGQLVGAGLLNRAEVERQLLSVALSTGLEEREALATIASGLDAGENQPREVPGPHPVATPVLPGQGAQPFGLNIPSKRIRSLLAKGWRPGSPYSRKYRSKAAAALSVTKELLEAGATHEQVTRALLHSPLTDGDQALVSWLLEKAQESPEVDDEIANLRRLIIRILTDAGREAGERATPMMIRRQSAGRTLLEHLAGRGYFVSDPLTFESYYMNTTDVRLLRVDKDNPEWVAWLHNLTEINPADQSFVSLHNDVLTRARLQGKRVAVVKVAAWDPENLALRVSRFDGTVHRLDGQTIATEPNGAGGILFEDDPAWQPYTPDFEPTIRGQDARSQALAWTLAGVPNWDGDAEAHALTLRAWLLSTFFPELMPTKPVLVMLGEKGSGKSMALRVILKLLFGPGGELSGTPDKPDGFTAAAAACHILALDNLDQFTGWLRDKIARLTTGAVDHYRRLYTSNEMGRVAYRVYLACTARTPDTLQRDDLADRLLLLPVSRVEDPEPESILLYNAAALRSAWWGDVLTELNRVVGLIRSEGIPAQARLRMADFESLAQIVARAAGKVEVWERTVKLLRFAQSQFLLEGEPIVDGLVRWLQEPGNQGREMTARELYEELTSALFGDDKPNGGWYKSSQSFGKKLANIRRDLRALFEVEWEKGTTQASRALIYRFRLPDEMP